MPCTMLRSRGLFPHDVHGRNVMMLNQRGVVVDVSDFLHEEPCKAWYHLKKAYYRAVCPPAQTIAPAIPLLFSGWGAPGLPLVPQMDPTALNRQSFDRI
jgi:hypothetical protein